MQHDRIMKKILVALALSTAALAVNAQFTTYQSINPKVSQLSGTQGNNDAPFTSYQSINARIRQNSDVRSGNGSNMQLPQRLIRGNEVTTIKYENGNITEVAMTSDGEDNSLNTKIFYTSDEITTPIDNKNHIMFFAFLLSFLLFTSSLAFSQVSFVRYQLAMNN